MPVPAGQHALASITFRKAGVTRPRAHSCLGRISAAVPIVRFYSVAKAAMESRLPLAVGGGSLLRTGFSDTVGSRTSAGVSRTIHHRTATAAGRPAPIDGTGWFAIVAVEVCAAFSHSPGLYERRDDGEPPRYRATTSAGSGTEPNARPRPHHGARAGCPVPGRNDVPGWVAEAVDCVPRVATSRAGSTCTRKRG